MKRRRLHCAAPLPAALLVVMVGSEGGCCARRYPVTVTREWAMPEIDYGRYLASGGSIFLVAAIPQADDEEKANGMLREDIHRTAIVRDPSRSRVLCEPPAGDDDRTEVRDDDDGYLVILIVAQQCIR